MANYDLSLQERKQRVIENCMGCGGDGDGFNFDGGGVSDTSTADMDLNTDPKKVKKAAKLDVAMNRVKRRKQKK